MTDVTKILNTKQATSTVEQDTAVNPAAVAEAATSIAQIELELKKLELADRQLEIKLKQANLIDSQERLAEREMKRDNIFLRAKTNGETIRQTNQGIKTQQNKCNHKKGGNGLAGIVGGQGDSPQYAILKHTFAGGNTEVRCLRCHKVWRKPAKSAFLNDDAGYSAALAEYNVALNFQTNNTASSSYTFGFSDRGEYYLEQTANS